MVGRRGGARESVCRARSGRRDFVARLLSPSTLRPAGGRPPPMRARAATNAARTLLRGLAATADPPLPRPLGVCVVGSGPAGCYVTSQVRTERWRAAWRARATPLNTSSPPPAPQAPGRQRARRHPGARLRGGGAAASRGSLAPFPPPLFRPLLPRTSCRPLSALSGRVSRPTTRTPRSGDGWRGGGARRVARARRPPPLAPSPPERHPPV